MVVSADGEDLTTQAVDEDDDGIGGRRQDGEACENQREGGESGLYGVASRLKPY